ncbi:hypothetical protein L4D76_11950 [Photobacterium sagamiensis]|uniref:hypothetical protein n=1 Tax=Photobacterium sagamiensis TaxID=2910241 RepID=UPI003D11E510
MRIFILLRLSIFMISILVCSVKTVAADWQFGYRGSSEQWSASNSLFFSESDDYLHQLAVDFSVEHKGIRGAATARKQWQRNRHNDEIILTELFVDRSIYDWDFTVGKKRLDWGVGYSYRPLDIIKSYIQQPTGVYIEEGAWVVAAEYYTATGALTLILADSTTQQETIEPQQKGGGIRYYALVNDWDLQGLMYFDDIRELSVGGSAVTVLGDSASVHVSALWQSQYTQLSHRLNAQQYLYVGDPIYSETENGALQLLTGVTYNLENSVSLLAEYWYDERSPDHSQWQSLIDAARQQKVSGDIYGLLSSERQFFSTHNTVQHKLLLHIRYDGDGWEPVLDLLTSPQDKGLIATARIRYQWMEEHWLELGARWFAGADNSVFQQLPHEQILFLQIDGTF